MQFHPQKCQLLRITRKRQPSNYTYSIHSVDVMATKDVKYLGVTISDNLSWNSHISNICYKANSIVNFLHRNFKDCSLSVKSKLYNTYVRPSLEYCSSVWDPYTDTNISQLERVQKRAARFTHKNFSREVRVTPMLQQLGWDPLSERRAKAKTTLLYKALNGLVDNPTDHLSLTSNRTRRDNNFFVPYARTDIYRHSFFISSTLLWNSLPASVRDSQSLSSFSSDLNNLTLRSAY